MARLTITLDDHLHQALKEAAARQGRTIGTIIEESLQLRGISLWLMPVNWSLNHNAPVI